MKYKLLYYFKKDDWKYYLKKLPVEQQDIYYTPELYKLYENYGDGKAFCFVYEENDKFALYPFLQNKINDLGFDLGDEYFDIQGAYGYNGVVTNCYEEKFINNFHQTFEHYCKENNIIAEFTRFHPLIQNQNFSIGHLNVIKDRKTVFVDLCKTEDEIWVYSYSSTNRNMIRKALKNNIEVMIASNIADYRVFNDIYFETMLNLGASQYLFFNEKYFIDFKDFIADNHKLILAKYNNQIVGGMILMFYKEYAHYHLSCRKGEYAKLALNNLFLDFALKQAKSRECKFFHLGGGTSSSEKDPLLKFKSNFSNNFANFYFGKKIHNQHIYDQILKQWQNNFPESYYMNKSKLLGYREIK